MNIEMIIVVIILLGVITLLLTGKLTSDVVSVLIIISLIFSGILSIDEAFSGFSNPVVITIASFFIICGALYHTEVSGLIGSQIIKISGLSEVKTTALVMAAGLLLSSIINNLAATAILLPGVISVSIKSRIAPSRLLMPLAYSTILGGMLTVVATQPNIIINEVLMSAEGRELGFFSMLPFGSVMAVIGFLYMLIIGRRLLPVKYFEEKIEISTSPEELPSIYQLEERLFELKVSESSSIAGRSLAESRLGSGYGINVIDIIHTARRRLSPKSNDRIMPHDRLIVQGREEDINMASEVFGLEIKKKSNLQKKDFMTDEIGIAELILPPRSHYAGKKLKEIFLRERFGVTVLAIWRSGKPIRSRLGEETLQLGDALLVRGQWNKLSMLGRTDEFLPVSGFETSPNPQHKDKMITSIIIIALMLLAVVSRILPVSLAAFTAAALMVITRCLTIAEAYRSVEWKMIILLAGFIPLGDAMVKTGLIDYFVRSLFYAFSGLGTLFILGLLFLISSVVSLLTSNITATILLSPVAFSMAGTFNISSEMLLITVALGASNGFMTPIAQQANLIVMGPGYYSLKDYLKTGTILSILVFSGFILSVHLFL
ncbi:MAG: SLC13 family permease [Desulfatiglans sp.]|nr:SLC13 family permease [Desulfatiglans sp.]